MSSGRYGRGWYSPPYFDGHRFGAIDGIRVLERPERESVWNARAEAQQQSLFGGSPP